MIAMAQASVWKEAFLDITLQQYLASFVVIVAATALNLMLKLYLNKKAEKWSAEKSLISSMLRLLIKPLRFLIVIVALVFVKRILMLPPSLDKTISNVLLVMFGLNIAFFLTRLVDLYVDGFLAPKVEKTESKLDDTLLLVVKKSVKWFIWLISVVVVLENLDVNIASLVAGLGIGGLAVALAAQETLKNFFGSIAIFSDRPFHVGERIQIEGTDGTVESVGFRSTKIRTLDGTLVTIPNSKVADSVINNIAKRPTIKNPYNIGITYDTSSEKLEKALEILRDVIGSHPSTEKHWVYFKEFGDFSLNIFVIHWCKYTDYQEFLTATEEINLEVKRQFEKEGIQFAFPSQTLYLENVEKEMG
jgi:MscS family membrane protein